METLPWSLAAGAKSVADTTAIAQSTTEPHSPRRTQPNSASKQEVKRHINHIMDCVAGSEHRICSGSYAPSV